MLKILVVNDVFPHIKNRTTILFKNIVPIIKKKLDVKIFWVITDNYGEISKITDPNYEILYLSSFNNAREILEEIKPDLCCHLVGPSIIDYAFMEAERSLNIPNFGYADSHYILSHENNEIIVGDYFRDQTSKQKIFSENVKQFFERKNLSEEDNIKASRGKNFLKKCLFLIKTLRSIGKSRKEITVLLFEFLKLLYFTPPTKFNEKFNCDLIFTESLGHTEYLQISGLKKENIRAVGNSAFDNAFEKRNQTKSNNNNILRILFITANLGSGQGKTDFSKSKRNQMINKTILKLQELKKEFSLIIKIHPASENYTEFKQFVGKSENIHLSQKDDIIELLTETDIVITPITSTAAVIALIMNKPIILWNYFHAEWDLLLRKNVVLECKNETELGYCIDSVEMFRKNNSEKINQFILENFGYGNASQRIVNEILDLIKKQKPQLNEK